MSREESVTDWLGQLQAGDRAAVQRLWERYFPRLVALARQKLQGVPRRVADEEDVALSAFASFCRNAERGRFPELCGRDGLWRLLLVITSRKSAHLLRDQGRQKRGGRAPPADHSAEGLPLHEVLSHEPSPAFAAEVAEECRRLLQGLPDPELEAVARARMEGYSVEEIAARLGRAPRSIHRKLALIRELWTREVTP